MTCACIQGNSCLYLKACPHLSSNADWMRIQFALMRIRAPTRNVHSGLMRIRFPSSQTTFHRWFRSSLALRTGFASLHVTAKHEYMIRYAKPKNITANKKKEDDNWITREQRTNVVILRSSNGNETISGTSWSTHSPSTNRHSPHTYWLVVTSSG